MATRPRLAGRPIPRRIAVLIVWRDESGSMDPYRTAQADFIPAVLNAVLSTAAGRQAADRVYVGYFVLSGETTASPFVPLPVLTEHMPPYEPNGYTPFGPSAFAVADAAEAFLGEVMAAESVVVDAQMMVFSDLVPHYPPGEADTTEAGVARLVEVVRTHGIGVTVVAPSPDVVNDPLAQRLTGSGRPVQYLGDDPGAVLRLTIDAVSVVSRRLVGRQPAGG